VTAALVAGLAAGYGVAIPVGAVATYLMSLTARAGLRVGACAALGVATVDGLYALLAAVGGTAVSAAVQPILVPLRWVSAAVLIGLAVRGVFGALRAYRGMVAARAVPGGALRAYARLVAITLLNPTTLIYFAALVLGGRATVGLFDRGVFVVAAFAASASWQLLLAAGGALLGRLLAGPRARLGTAIASAALMAGLAVRLVV